MTNSVVGTKAAGPGPTAIAYDPTMGEIFVKDFDTSAVTIISDSTTVSTASTTTSMTASTTTSTASSSLAFQPSYLTLVAINIAVLVVIATLSAKTGSNRRKFVSRD